MTLEENQKKFLETRGGEGNYIINSKIKEMIKM